MTKRPRTLILFYVLVAYIGFQFIWWSYLLTSMTGEVYLQKEATLKARIQDEIQLEQELAMVKKKQRTRIYMIIGEGSVFLLLLTIGIFRVKLSIQKEVQLARQQKNFMLSVTHELKTPLAAVKLNLQTLQKHELDKEKRKEVIATCLRETERLNQLIENVLLAARMENAEMQFLKEKIDLHEFLTTQLISTFNDERIRVLSTKNTFVSCDRLALASIISNLTENALKYGEGNVNVEVRTGNKYVTLDVKDNGPGIPNSEKSRVFDKFYRLGNEETRKTKGTGLGLFIVKNLAEKNGIQISLTDNEPRGCIFRLTFVS